MGVTLSSIYCHNEKNQIDRLIRYPFCRMLSSLHILMQPPRTFTLPDCPYSIMTVERTVVARVFVMIALIG